ncbi:unnamed protein product [Didymodactylos carnosus]|uniref:Uncharacterized protein n=1 Tax=Didymodactylos carnosus TaxID=1234261 RepID=A0A815DHT4_9BILA|nr:unnamed protein product [Didymodactylos carnosus]CAF4117503.1 unnamed protein product [Didymodactylos carnosus]
MELEHGPISSNNRPRPLQYALPTIQSLNNKLCFEKLSEAEFCYNEVEQHMKLINCSNVFISEDCTGIIPRVEYDVNKNCFTGFVTPMVNDEPVPQAYRCTTFEQLEHLYGTVVKSTLVNIYVVQPITNLTTSSIILFAYGTNNKITTTKIRNRLLSSTCKLLMGSYQISIKHLYQLIETNNKLDHSITKCDLNVRDRIAQTMAEYVKMKEVLMENSCFNLNKLSESIKQQLSAHTLNETQSINFNEPEADDNVDTQDEEEDEYSLNSNSNDDESYDGDIESNMNDHENEKDDRIDDNDITQDFFANAHSSKYTGDFINVVLQF